MADALTSSMSQIEGKKVCEVFGHKARRYGNGVFCENCDIEMKDEDVVEIKIHRNSEPKPSWMLKYRSFK